MKLLERKEELLWVIPAVLCVLVFVLKLAHGPYYLVSNSDPEYAYLFNGLVLIEGNGEIGMIYHPGISLITVVGAVIWLTNLLFGTMPLLEDVLSNPELYLNSVQVVLTLLGTFSLYYLGNRVYKYSRNFWLAVAFQLIPFSSIHILESFISVSPDTLIVSTSLLIFCVIADLMFGEKGREWQHVLLLSCLTGFILVSKINCLPIIILPFLLIPNKWHKIFYVVGSVAFFFFFFLPAIHKFQYFYEWLVDITFHSGIYGKGEKEVANSGSIANIIKILSGIRLLMVLPIVGFLSSILVFLKPSWLPDAYGKLLMASGVAGTLQIIMTAKHFYEGAYFYALPSLMLMLPAAIILALVIVPMLTEEYFKYGKLGFLIVLALLVIPFSPSFAKRASYFRTLKMHGNRTISFLEKEKQYPLISSFQSSGQGYAVRFGLEFILPPKKEEYAQKAKYYYPNQYNFDIWKNKLDYWMDTVNFNQLYTTNKHIYLQGNSLDINSLPSAFAMDDSLRNSQVSPKFLFFPSEGDRLIEFRRE